MENEIIRLQSIDLVYQTAESLSVKKAIKSLFLREKMTFLHRHQALTNISLSIESGKVYGVIGSNGAGKSTLLRVLSGVMSPTAGSVERNYKTINLLALGVGFSREMSGYHNVLLNGMLLGFSKKEILEKLPQIVEYSELSEFIDRPMKTYSSGMISRLGFSIALHLKPEVLLIDEVLSVGDTKFREKSFASIREIILDASTTVVIVSHSMAQLYALCDKAIWLDKGHLVAAGDCPQLLKTYERYSAGEINLAQAKAYFPGYRG